MPTSNKNRAELCFNWVMLHVLAKPHCSDSSKSLEKYRGSVQETDCTIPDRVEVSEGSKSLFRALADFFFFILPLKDQAHLQGFNKACKPTGKHFDDVPNQELVRLHPSYLQSVCC